MKIYLKEITQLLSHLNDKTIIEFFRVEYGIY